MYVGIVFWGNTHGETFPLALKKVNKLKKDINGKKRKKKKT